MKKMKPEIVALIHTPRIEVERLMREGRISHSTFIGYLAVWRWCSPRFGGWENVVQDAFYDLHGKDAYHRRVNRVREACGFYPIPFLA